MGKKKVLYNNAVCQSLCVSITRRRFCRIKWITLQQATMSLFKNSVQ